MIDERQRILDKQKLVKKLVEDLLKTDKHCRNSDLWLVLQIWVKSQNIDLKIPYE